MALRDQPFLPLYVQDFLTDEKLNECSAASTGVYIKLMCIMHKSNQYGKIMLRSLPIDLPQQNEQQNILICRRFAEQLVRHLPFSVEEIFKAICELLKEGVLYLEGDFLCQKRMIHDNELSIKRATSGKKGSDVTNKRFAAKFDEAVADNFAAAKNTANTENENEYNIESTIDTNIHYKTHTLIARDFFKKKVELFDDLQKFSLMLIPEMEKVWKELHPNYPSSKNDDYAALLHVAYYIADQKGWKKAEVLKERKPDVLASWRKIADFLAKTKNKHFKTFTLNSLSITKNIQSVQQAMLAENDTPEARRKESQKKGLTHEDYFDKTYFE